MPVLWRYSLSVIIDWRNGRTMHDEATDSTVPLRERRTSDLYMVEPTKALDHLLGQRKSAAGRTLNLGNGVRRKLTSQKSNLPQQLRQRAIRLLSKEGTVLSIHCQDPEYSGWIELRLVEAGQTPVKQDPQNPAAA